MVVSANLMVPLAVPWLPKVSKVSLCLLPSYPVLPELYINAVAQVNSFTAANAHGLRLEIVTACKPESSTITFGPAGKPPANNVNNILGQTTRTLILNGSLCTRVAVAVDVRVLQTAGLFYSVLLHELLHAVGLNHPIPGTPPSLSVMATSRQEVDGSILQQLSYSNIKRADIAALRLLMERDRPMYKFPKNSKFPWKFPIFPASGHVSGNNKYDVPIYLPLWWISRTEIGAKFYYTLSGSADGLLELDSADSGDSYSIDDSSAPTNAPTKTARSVRDNRRNKAYTNGRVKITANVAPEIHDSGNRIIDIISNVNPIING